MFKEIIDANYIIQMMEDVFGHRITSWNPEDTRKLKGKLYQPISDKEKEEYVKIVEPLMNKKSIIPKKKDAFLDSFVDLDVRVSQDDYSSSDDEDAKELEKLLGVDLSNVKKEKKNV
jgi:hypothetical protein